VCCVLPRHTRSNPYPNAETHARCGVLPPAKARKAREILFFSPLTPPPVPVVVETINPTAAALPLSCGDHRSRDLGAVVVVDIKESTTHGVLVVFPSRLPPTNFLIACHLPPTFWSSARPLCCSSPPHKKTTHVYPPGVLPTPLLTSPPFPFYPTPCYPTHGVRRTPYP